MFRNRVRI